MHIWNISSVHFLLHNLDMKYEYFNPNPAGRRVGDCAVRAVAKALNIDWETSYSLIAKNGFYMCDMPSSDSVWGAVLRQHGFNKHIVPNMCPDCYTAMEFVDDHNKGIYVIGFGGHVATSINGVLYDSWNSSNEIPIYYWTKEDVDHGI
jgi:hypothetical protein